jgi:hypothetical protein
MWMPFNLGKLKSTYVAVTIDNPRNLPPVHSSKTPLPRVALRSGWRVPIFVEGWLSDYLFALPNLDGH